MSSNLNYKFNLLPSPISENHFLFDSLDNLPDSFKKYGSPPLKIPSSVNYRPFLNPCRDQGNENACVSFSACGAKEYQEKINCKFSGYFSPQFIYFNRSDSSQDSGMSIQELTHILLKLGVCSENECLFSSVHNKSSISSSAYSHALNFKIKAYAQIKSLDGLKLALAQNGPCLIGVNVYNYSSSLWKPNPGDKNLGGHCMLAVSYDDHSQLIGIRNSWGHDSWGDLGYTYMHYSDFHFILETWTIVDDTSSINVYLPKIDPLPPKQLILATAIQEIIPSPNHTIHKIWIKLLNKSTSHLSHIKLSVSCDQIIHTWKIDRLPSHNSLLTPNSVSIPPNSEYICGIDCISNHKKPIVSLV